MQYIFVLGRDPELSKVEVESLLESKNIKFKVIDDNNKVLVVDSDKLNPKIIDEFGGIIKIAEVISNTDKLDEIESNLENLYTGKSNKIEYYIDPFNTDLLSFTEDFLKDYFKGIKLKALYKRNSDPSKLINKNILENGLDLVIFKNLISKTIAITNPLEIKKRDLNRPEVDYAKVISIRLAKILINLSGVKKGGKLLDPFCGSGTILQEALLRGINVIGVDSDMDSIKQCEKNLEWLKKHYTINNNFEILNLDCRRVSDKVKKVDCVVTEPYMGPYIKKLPSMNEARELVLDLKELYGSLLSDLKNIINKDGKIVIMIPIFRTRENKKVFLDFEDVIDKNGFELVRQPISYGDHQKLMRIVYILTRSIS